MSGQEDPHQSFADGLDLLLKAPTTDFSLALKKATHILEAALGIFGTEGLALSFNGGKDATVSLHLLIIVLIKLGLYTPGQAAAFPVRCIYFEEQHPFPEVADFVEEMKLRYKLILETYTCPFKEGILEFTQRFKTQGFIMGTRRIDPHSGNLEHMSPSSPDWPCFVRVHPLLEWSYEHIWGLLRDFKLPYCDLYDRGYTSVGNVKDTVPNPALRNADGSFQPAYLLLNGSSEREGRSPGPTPGVTPDPSPFMRHTVGIVLVVQHPFLPQSEEGGVDVWGVVADVSDVLTHLRVEISKCVVVGSIMAAREVQDLGGSCDLVIVGGVNVPEIVSKALSRPCAMQGDRELPQSSQRVEGCEEAFMCRNVAMFLGPVSLLALHLDLAKLALNLPLHGADAATVVCDRVYLRARKDQLHPKLLQARHAFPKVSFVAYSLHLGPQPHNTVVSIQGDRDGIDKALGHLHAILPDAIIDAATALNPTQTP